MNYMACLIGISDEVEGEVMLAINGFNFTCFAYSSLPYHAKTGSIYPVELTPFVVNDYVITEVNEETISSINNLDSSFSCSIVGRLHGKYLTVGDLIIFEDDILLSDFSYLDGKMIKWVVDRMDADFL